MSLVAHYKLDGNALDSSGNGFNGTASNVTWVNGKLGQCANAGSITVPHNNKLSFLDSMTTSFWIRRIATVEGYAIQPINKWAGTGAANYVCYVFGDDQRLQFYANAGGVWTNVSGSYVLPLNEWVHIVWTYNNGGQLFVNGNTVGGKTASGALATTTANLVMNNTYFQLDDVRVYDHALSTKEVKELSKAKVLHYKFDDFQEPTTNSFIMDGQDDVSPFAGDGSPSLSVIHSTVKFRGYKVAHFTTGTSGNFYLNGATRIRTDILSTEWTSTFYIKRVDGTAISSVGTYMYVTNNTNVNTTVSVTEVEDGWYKVVRTRDGLVSGYPSLAGCYSLGASTSYYIATWQIEAKKHETPYIIGSRSGTVTDCSSQGNDAALALTTTPKWTSDSKIGTGGYEFDGVDDFLTLPTNYLPSLTNCSVSFWRKKTTAGGWLLFRGQSNGHYILATSEGTGDFYHGTAGTSWQIYVDGQIRANPIDDNNWHHYVMTNIDLSTWTQLTLSNYGGWHFRGVLDDLRIYNYVLTADDIQELYQTRASVDNSGNFHTLCLNDYYSQYKKFAKDSSRDTNFYIYAKQYPSDGTSPVAGIYVNSILAHQYSRDWHISVWDAAKNDWASDVNFYGASQIVAAGRARYDVWQGTVRAAQQTAFVNTLQNMNYNYIVMIGASHAPEFYNEAMANEIVKFGGTHANLQWTTRESYICVGKRDVGEGNAIVEALSNLNSANNGGYTWARVDFDLFKEKNSIKEDGVTISSSLNELGPTNGLVAYYPFHKDASDYSGNNNDGTVSGATLVAGQNGGMAYNFTTTNDKITTGNIGTIVTTNNISFSCWLNRTNSNNAFNMFMGQFLPYFGLRSGGDFIASLNINGGQVTVTTSGSYTDNTWYNFVYTYDGSNSRIFINGALAASASHPGNIVFYPEHQFTIGDGYQVNWYPFIGKVQDVRIYNRALSTEDINILYTMTGPSDTKMKQTKDSLFIKGEFKETY